MMKSPAGCFLLLCAALQAGAVPVPSPDNGISRPRREHRADISDSRNADATRRPRIGESGWQYIPGNKWKAPRDAETEKRRADDRIRRRKETPRLRFE